MVPEDDMQNAVSLNSALMTGSRVVGPVIAGLLVVNVGFGWCFLVDAFSYVAVLAGLWLMRSEELRPAPVTRKGKGQIRDGLRYARSVPELWVPLVMMAAVGTLSYNFQTVFPLFNERDLHGSTTTYTWLFAVVSVGALIGALRVARRHTTSIRSVALSSLGYGAAMTVMAFAPNRWIAYAVGLFLGVTSIAFLTSSTAIVQMRSAPEMRGRVLALQAMLFLGSTPIGGPIVGWIAQQFGARYAIGVGAVAAFGAGVWGLAKVRHATVEDAPDTGIVEADIAAVDVAAT
jgi:predicted MFS family arabinose efflux permease